LIANLRIRAFVIGYLCLSSVVAAHAGISPCESDALCGPRCLLAVCQRYNVEANLEELSSACGIGGESDAKGTCVAFGAKNRAEKSKIYSVFSGGDIPAFSGSDG
jgi:hypothetical protein